MSEEKAVIILTPNGRRQVIKVNNHTTVMTMLEMVCEKHGFKPEDYDLKHHKKILDVTSAMLFSGLPNNAQLEMVAVKKQREETAVTIALQLESGERRSNIFSPTVSLWYVIETLCPEEADPSSNPLIIYMRQNIIGVHDLQNTTLHGLGIFGGRAMLRYLHRRPEELHYQANMSAPLVRTAAPVKAEIATQSEKPSTQTPADMSSSPTMSQKQTKGNNVCAPEEARTVLPPKNVTTCANPVTESTNGVGSCTDDSNGDIQESEQQPPPEKTEDKVVLIGDRDAVAFNRTVSSPVVSCAPDLADDFYDVTLEDIRTIYRDLKNKRFKLEEKQPMLTTEQRTKLEADRLNTVAAMYPKVVLRVHFPDRTVLQGTFAPLETIQHVMDFVKSFLRPDIQNFYLYTAPPKEILQPETRLLETACLPGALFYFGTASPDSSPYLKQSVLENLSTFSAAAKFARETRKHSTHGDEADKKQPAKCRDTVDDEQPSTSDECSRKVPAWFKR